MALRGVYTLNLFRSYQALWVIGWVTGLLLLVTPIHAQTLVNVAGVCDDVQFLMRQRATPAELMRGSGSRMLAPDATGVGSISNRDIGDYWQLQVTGNRDPLRLQFSTGSITAPLEFAVFRGMQRVLDYAPVVNNTPVIIDSPATGIYTVVVRLVNLADSAGFSSSQTYTIRANYTGSTTIQTALPPLVDTSTSDRYTPQLDNGLQVIPSFPRTGAYVEFHAGSLPQGNNISSSITGNRGRTQLFFAPVGAMLIDDWASYVSYAGGDLSVRGQANERERIFYLEDAYFLENNTTSGELNNFTDSRGTNVVLDWSLATGVWMTDTCVGVALNDGRTFMTTVDNGDTSRRFSLTPANDLNACETFRTRTPSGNFRACIPIDALAANTSLTYFDGVFTANLIDSRTLSLQSADIVAIPLTGLNHTTESFPLTVTLDQGEVTLSLDWVNIGQLGLVDGQLSLSFRDSVRQAQGVTQRPATDLVNFDAINDVIKLVYASGEQHLLLPETESYLEIITPAGAPTFGGFPFDGRAVAGEAGYAPRSLNNTGGECYPVNTTLDVANCAKNGHINAANGNLWYAVNDLVAHAPIAPFTLTRSYNSNAAAISGLFGRGWTAQYPIDYPIPFDPETNSRPILLASGTGIASLTPSSYRIGLDLTWEPRGLIIMRTGSGSEHHFTRVADGQFKALTMPDWTLSQPDERTNWTLHDGHGFVALYDRAGRLIQMGYPAENYRITIDYPRTDVLAGVGGLTEPVIITDAPQMRQLELTFNADGFVSKSRLRDLTQSTTGEPCTLDVACYETQYRYDGDLLTDVTYADGLTATYTYDNRGRLIHHSDPRAPISPDMAYIYQARDPGIAQAYILNPGETEPTPDNLIWRTLIVVEDTSSRTVSYTDEYNNTRYDTFTFSDGVWNRAGTHFNLQERLEPLVSLGGYYALPIPYEWNDGLLTAIGQRGNQSAGRSRTAFVYAPDSGQLIGLRGSPGQRGASPNFSMAVSALAEAGYTSPLLTPTRIDFADGTFARYAYDDAGRLIETVDHHGAITRYTRDRTGRILTRTLAIPAGDSSSAERIIWEEDYTYDDRLSGLITSIRRYNPALSDDPGYIVSFSYDALGRIIAVEDSVAGRYTIRYEAGFDDTGMTRIVITDPVLTDTVTTFDFRGRVTEQVVIVPGQDDALRRTTYAYEDQLGRLTQQVMWLDDRPLTTTYTYEQVAVTGSNFDTIVTQRAPDQTVSYRYDALGRVKRVDYGNGYNTTFEYFATEVDNPLLGVNPFGLRIEQVDRFGDRITRETRYIFEERWQLVAVDQTERSPAGEAINQLSWQLLMDNNLLDSTHYRRLQSNTGINGVDWPTTQYIGGQASTADITLQTPDSNQRTHIITGRDALGRPIRVSRRIGTADEQQMYTLAYCQDVAGSLTTLLSLPDITVDCTATNDQLTRRLTTDAHGRPVRITDEFGTRSFEYTITPDTHIWGVRINAGNYSWALDYNAVGELIEWRTDAGIVTRYERDDLGRLTGVTVTQGGILQPEASFTYRYNDAHQVIEIRDGAGRGQRFDYDERGNLVLQQNTENGSAIVYAYDLENRVNSIISELGAVTNVTYDAAGRLSQIISPTSTRAYRWDIVNRELIYTDPRGSNYRYTFDAFDVLRAISGPLNAELSVLYDGLGRLTRTTRTIGEHTRQTDIMYQADTLTLTRSQADDWAFSIAMSPAGKITALNPTAADDTRFSLRYDVLGRLSSVHDANDTLLWSADFTAGSPIITLTSGEAPPQTVTYDALYRLTGITNGQDTSIQYAVNSNGTLFITITQGDEVRTYAIRRGDGVNPPQMTLHRAGQRVIYNYDAEGRVESIETETCITNETLSLTVVDVQSNPPACGNLTAPVQRTVVRFGYDADGNPVRVVDEEQNIQTFSYDAVGNLTIYQTEDGETYTYTYDRLNRLTSITSPSDAQVWLDYTGTDVSGICRVNADAVNTYDDCVAEGGLIETYAYDALGRLITQTFPNTGRSFSAEVEMRYTDEGQIAEWGTRDSPQSVATFAYTQLGLLEQITLGSGEDYLFDYANNTRLSQITLPDDTLNVTYDDQGRLSQISGDRGVLTYSYAPDGYTVTDEASGASLTFAASPNGLLRLIDYVTGDASATDQPLLSLNYTDVDDNGTLSVLMEWSDGFATALQFNRKGDVTFVQHVAPDPDQSDYNLRLVYNRNPAGKEQSVIYEVDGNTTITEMQAEGYLVVMGYDRAGLPLLLRLNDTGEGGLLYLQNFTYDVNGRLIRESQQYADGSRIDITYMYDASQLIGRQVVVSEQMSQISLWSSLAGLALVFGVVGTARRRRTLILVFVVICAFSGVYLNAQSQQATLIFEYVYTYDTSGNLNTITGNDEVCAVYTYDSLNRLTRITQGDGVHRLDYDVYGRVTRINDLYLMYSGGSDLPTFMQSDDNLLNVFGLLDSSALFRAVGESVTQFVTNATGDVLARRNPIEIPSPETTWLFDPYQRFIKLASPPVQTACDFDRINESRNPSLPTLAIVDGVLWHTPSNTMFKEGRAYLPSAGRFMQRDPLGPDARGSAYGNLNSRLDLPRRPQEPLFAAALTGLADVNRVQSLKESLHAHQIEQIHAPYPAGYQQADVLARSLRSAPAHYQQATGHLQTLPYWLTRHYNLSGVTLDPMTGALSLSAATAPGHEVKAPLKAVYDDLIWQSDPLWIPDHVALTADRTLTGLTDRAQPIATVPRTYLRWGWLPDHGLKPDIWQTPSVAPVSLPSAVLAYLPRPLDDLTNATATTDWLEQLDVLHTMTRQDWLAKIQSDAFPVRPDLLPGGVDEFLETWFTVDTFGLIEALNQRYQPPVLPQLPTYTLEQAPIPAPLNIKP